MQMPIFILHLLWWIVPQMVPMSCHSTNPLLLVISLDGFRWDYLDIMKEKHIDTPNFDKFIEEGGKAEYLKTVYPSKTYPTHWSIATGLYTESHGLVQNKFWDPKFEEAFLYFKKQFPQHKWFDNDGTVEPIWISNQRGAQSPVYPRHSGVIFWPGGSAGYGEDTMHPTYHFAEKTELNDTERIKNAISWFATEDEPINFAMVHLSGTDHIGHTYGPESDEVIAQIQKIDDQLALLQTEMEKHHLDKKLNVIILSDHGMAKLTENLTLDDYIDPSLYKAYGYSPMWQFIPEEGKEEAVKDALQKLADSNPNVTLYLDQKTPKEYHFSKHRRVLSIILRVSEGVLLIHNKSDHTVLGDHGYPDNEAPSMRAFLAARGPAFHKGARISPVSQVDLYPLMCHILHLPTCHPHNGSMDEIQKLLRVDELAEHNAYVTLITFVTAVGFAATVSGVFCVAACRVYRVSRVRRMHIRRPDLALNNINSEVKRSLLSSDEEEI